MALLWGFVQYKNLWTESVRRQSDIGLQWLRSEVQTELGTAPAQPSDEAVRASLRRIVDREPDSTGVVYYLDTSNRLLAIGGGVMGAPRPPWYVRDQIQ